MIHQRLDGLEVSKKWVDMLGPVLKNTITQNIQQLDYHQMKQTSTVIIWMCG